MSRFEIFNEIMFEAYCKKAVSNATKKERQKKSKRGQMEQSLSALTDAALYSLATETAESDGAEQSEEPYTFHVQGMNIPVYNPKLSKALFYLMPKDREIILLYYFKGLKYTQIAPLVHISASAVSRRNRAATKRLRELIENAP